MVIDKTKVKRILIITLSNTGDCILTIPVLRTVVGAFPKARIDVMAGPAGKEVFEKDPAVSKFIIYDKYAPVLEKRRILSKLRRLRYDLVVDLKNTMFGLLMGPRYRTSTVQTFPKKGMHSRDLHLLRLKGLGIEPIREGPGIYIPKEDEESALKMLEKEGVLEDYVAVSPGAKSHLKRWPEDAFAALGDILTGRKGFRVVFVGTGQDADIIKEISKKMKNKAVNLSNRTNLRELAAVLKKARLVVTNDSAPLHLACSVGARVVAIFGPTDPARYGPTGGFDRVVMKKIFCSPCESAECRFNYECMRVITPDEVYEAAVAALKDR